MHVNPDAITMRSRQGNKYDVRRTEMHVTNNVWGTKIPPPGLEPVSLE
jgi:hypothetical protein